jgi:hypothetical protein
MAIRLLNADERVTVLDSELLENGDKDTSYTIRKLTPEAQREIVKRNTRPGNFRKGDTVNWQKVQDDQIDYIVEDWTGIKAGAEAAPCTRANKLLLDPVRKVALIDRAGLQEIEAVEADRQESFRSAS